MPAKVTQSKGRSRSPIRIYFLIVTLVGVIGSLITVGMLLYTSAQKLIITDKEYVIGQRYYELDVCSQNVYKPTAINPNNYVVPTDAEKEKCKADKMAQLIEARQATFKTDLLGAGIWAILFVILLLTHYGRFLKRDE